MIIFMSGAHGVVGWVWSGDGWVSVDRWLFRPPLWRLGGFGTVVFGNTELRARGFPTFHKDILYDEMYIMIIEK